MKGGYVYLLTNKNHTVLYTGVTSNLVSRIFEHITNVYPGFTKKYNCKKLVYWEFQEDIELAIQREKRIKKYSRKRKEQMISNLNPDWKDLYEDINHLD